ncbi:prephenate dehydrogenase/arogenate dehydrogenase family protein [Streptomyces spongiicola]|uniref:Prephenate dehydrogenase/arogenate dehydrogenase family protein n=1 Tax=Streptomyces spongiicola TaxID=1690221 RepID=A0A388T5Q4_9ACTN|nr:prephenate dehydrogenase/arogenate dehydrogenase family protein [Streptomyces spongiicola]GBQ03521.1 prephenate dehydrogenase/arogenate dehydrogenase family protein [Streptomyces spongiicola]
MSRPRLRSVTVIGCGLIGTSLALRLSRSGIAVSLADLDPAAVALGAGRGAGAPLAPDAPPADLVVVATPPSAVVDVLYEAQARGLGRAYTDVAAAKGLIWEEAVLRGCDLRGYVPGHPMAGRGLSGTAAAEPGLFAGRPWILCPGPSVHPEAAAAVEELVSLCGAVAHTMPPTAHDEAVATVSHTPMLVAVALAAQLADAAPDVLALAGGGLRDTTRIAASDPGLWSDILTHNAPAVAASVERVAADLVLMASALRDGGDTCSVSVGGLLLQGHRGRAALLDATGSRNPGDARCRTPV